MTTEDRLRKAITHHTDRVEPTPDSLDRIEEALMQPSPVSPKAKWAAGGVAATVVLVVAAVFALGGGDDDPHGVATEPGVTTSVAPTTAVEPGPVTTTDPRPGTTVATTVPTTVPTTEGGPTTSVPDEVPSIGPVLGSEVVWPRPGHEARFDDPVAAARSFATFYAGFIDPIVGGFAQGDSRSGEVEVRPAGRPDGPPTTVQVRRMADDNWWVIAASSADIELTHVGLDRHGSLACVGSTRIAGRALAFEGHVDVRIDGFGVDGSRHELGRSFGTGAGSPPAAPFTAEVPCDRSSLDAASTDSGAVVMAWTDSAEDGSRSLVTALPVPLLP